MPTCWIARGGKSKGQQAAQDVQPTMEEKPMRILALITEPQEVRKTLRHFFQYAGTSVL
jgi:hypothetical protein